jgi:hypothetical protein
MEQLLEYLLRPIGQFFRFLRFLTVLALLILLIGLLNWFTCNLAVNQDKVQQDIGKAVRVFQISNANPLPISNDFARHPATASFDSLRRIKNTAGRVKTDFMIIKPEQVSVYQSF